MAKWYEKVGSELSRLGKEAGKGAAIAAREVGKGAKVAASEVKKTVGIGVGDIKINLSAREFKLGETITGSLELELNEEMSAKKLVIGLVGTRKKISYSTSASGSKTQETHTETVHDFEIELGGERDYETESFEISLPVPTEAVKREPEIKTGGVLGDVARVVASVKAADTTPVRWKVYATLDIPWKRNLSSSVDVAVT